MHIFLVVVIIAVLLIIIPNRIEKYTEQYTEYLDQKKYKNTGHETIRDKNFNSLMNVIYFISDSCITNPDNVTKNNVIEFVKLTSLITKHKSIIQNVNEILKGRNKTNICRQFKNMSKPYVSKTNIRLENKKQQVDTEIWGPSMWMFLHTTVLLYPNNPTNTDNINNKKIFTHLANVMPCETCRQNLKHNLLLLNFNNLSFNNKQTYHLFIWKLHNLVNKELNKKQIPYLKSIQLINQ